MLKRDLIELIKEMKDEDDVDEVLANSELAAKFGSLETFKEKIEKDSEFKSFLDSEKDKHLSKGIETFKTNNLQALIDGKIKELYPEEDPKDSELSQLKQEIENMKKETLKKELTNLALKTATEKKLPVDLVDYFVGSDEETTLKNIESFEKVFSDKMEKMVMDKLKGSSYEPPSDDTRFDSLTKEEFLKMDYLEQQEFATKKPELYKEIIE